MTHNTRVRSRRAIAAATLVAGTTFALATVFATDTASARRGTSDTAVLNQTAREGASQGEVERRLRALEDEYDARIGAYAIDTATGRSVGHRTQELFPMTSTFKALACAAVLDKARHEEPGLMDRVVHYTSDDLVDWSPITKDHVASGMTVAALCDAAITMSDNTAGNLILQQIGGPDGFTEYLRSLGDPRSRLDRWETDLNDWQPGERRDTTTPALMAQDLLLVTTTDALAEPDQEQLLAWMRANTTGDERIRAGVPSGWVVADKTGTGGTYATANDIAVVWPDDGAPIIITIYTNRMTPAAQVDNTLVARTASVLVDGLRELS